VKKLFFVILVLFQFCVFAAGTNEEWMSGGGEYAHLTEKQSPEGTDITTTLNSIGIVIRSNTFKENMENGTFVNTSYLIPQGGELKSSGSTYDYSLSESDFRIHLTIL